MMPATLPTQPEAAAAEAEPQRAADAPWSSEHNPNNLAMFTLVLWLVCLAVGALGFLLRYERPRAPAPPDPPILAQQLQVELTRNLLPPDAGAVPPEPLAPPPPPDRLVQPIIVQPIVVAQPGPAIAFPLPVEAPAGVVEANRADYIVPPVTSAPPQSVASLSTAEPLAFGQGEGKQPAPGYPPAARRQGQEGTVLVRLTVGEDGRVRAAEAVRPSPWPLLNEAAVRTVRERWRFRTGPMRVYEVTIRFEITN